MSANNRVVCLDDLEGRGGDEMEFRLTYSGKLVASQGDARDGQLVRLGKRENQHAIRSHFHSQLKRLWESTHFLAQATGLPMEPSHDDKRSRAQALAERHSHFGMGFIPLVSSSLQLRCELEILFLRGDLPGRISWAGDIDNRIKTLLDALRIPEAGEDYATRAIADELKPMYCLLEDDKLISKLSVETDQLLDVSVNGFDEVALVITVRVAPYRRVNFDNLDFV